MRNSGSTRISQDQAVLHPARRFSRVSVLMVPAVLAAGRRRCSGFCFFTKGFCFYTKGFFTKGFCSFTTAAPQRGCACREAAPCSLGRSQSRELTQLAGLALDLTQLGVGLGLLGQVLRLRGPGSVGNSMRSSWYEMWACLNSMTRSAISHPS